MAVVGNEPLSAANLGAILEAQGLANPGSSTVVSEPVSAANLRAALLSAGVSLGAAVGDIGSKPVSAGNAYVVNQHGGFEALKPTLNDYTWPELIDVCQGGKYSADDLSRYVGNVIGVAINGLGSFSFRMIGVAHDDRADGHGKAMMTFMSHKIVTTHDMCEVAETYHGWGESTARSYLNEEFLSLLPNDLQSGILTVLKKWSRNDDGKHVAQNNVSEDKVWLASSFEMMGDHHFSNLSITGADEGEQYQYWKNANSNEYREKIWDGSPYSGYENRPCQFYWLRTSEPSVWTHGENWHHGIDNDGSASSTLSTRGMGIVPCFCI